MAFPAGCGTGLFALFDPVAMTPRAMIHNPLFRQFALVFQILDNAELLGKDIMADVAITQRRLMLSMGETDRASLASVKSYLFRAFCFNAGNDDTTTKKHEYSTQHNNF
jgi:hypothetical protein